MHACQIGPTDTAPPHPGSPHQSCIRARGNALKQVTFLPPFLHSLHIGATTLSHLDPWLWCYLLPFDDIVDVVGQLGSSSSSIAGLLVANTGGGITRFRIRCWVAVAIGRLCRSYANSILCRIVKVAKTAPPGPIFRRFLA